MNNITKRIASIDLVSQIPGYERFTSSFLESIMESETHCQWLWSYISFYGLKEFHAVIEASGQALIVLDKLDEWIEFHGLR